MRIRIAEVRAFIAAVNASIVPYRAAQSGAAHLSGEKDTLATGQGSVWAPHEIDSESQRSTIPVPGLGSGALPTEKSVPDSRG